MSSSSGAHLTHHQIKTDAEVQGVGMVAANSNMVAEPINILIVDDEPSNLVVLETVLDDPAYRLVKAQSADEALLALMAHEFAVLILDIRLPGMTGFELAHLIKERKKTASVPIIFLTAYYDKDHHVVEGYSTGAVDFLSKPVNPTVLRSKVAVFAELDRKNREVRDSNAALMAEVLERRRAEEELRELNETLEQKVSDRTRELFEADVKLHAMMNSITDGLAMLDKNWCYTYVNEQGTRMLGMRAEQLIGKCVWDLFLPSHVTQFYEGCHRAVETGRTVVFDEFYPDPVNMWFECHCYPSEDGLSVYFQDITDRRDIESRREHLLAAEQAARNEGERVARAKDEFLASLSHELRTPLAAIVGWVKILKRAGPYVETVNRGIDAIERNAYAQSRLISDLLDMSRIVSGKLRMDVEEVDLNRIAAATADSVQPTAQNKGITVELRLAESMPSFIGDEARLHQITSNLVNNALKFTPRGGTVKISTTVNDEYIEMAVADTGQGIAADFLPHLFDRFSQADGSAMRFHGGLGLGLSIVKNLVELHSGTVSAASAGPGQGATFTAIFPRSGAAMSKDLTEDQTGDGFTVSRPQLLDDQIDLSGVSVLLVDDHPDVLEMQRRLLCDYQASVTAAGSGEDAFEQLTAREFNVLVSDLGMPGMDGYRLIDKIRTELALSAEKLPAAALTAFVRPEDKQRALQAGYQTCITKPVSPTTLARTVLDLAHTRVRDHEKLRVLFVEDHDDLREQLEWMLREEGLDYVSCADAEHAEIEFGKQSFDVVITDVSLPGVSGVDLARSLLARSPQQWIIFSTGYPMKGDLSGFGPHVRAMLKPFSEDELGARMQEVRDHIKNKG